MVVCHIVVEMVEWQHIGSTRTTTRIRLCMDVGKGKGDGEMQDARLIDNLELKR